MSGVLNRIASLLTWVSLGLCVWTLLAINQAVAAKTSLAALIAAVVVIAIRSRN